MTDDLERLVALERRARDHRESGDYNLRGGFESEHVESLVLAQT